MADEIIVNEEVTKSLEELEEATKSLRDFMERSEQETKEFGGALTETKTTLEAIQTRIDEIETGFQRHRVKSVEPGQEYKEDPEYAQYWGELKTYLSKGVEARPEETKTLIVSNDELGGYLAPSEYVREIIKGITEFSPIRSLARVRNTSSKSIQIPVRKGTFAAQWVSEIEERDETPGLRWGLEEIFAHELNAYVKISRTLMEDAAFDMEEEISTEVDEQFGVAEATAFLVGNGVGKPEGILTHAGITTVPSGTNDVITADDLIRLYYTPKTPYARNGTFLLNRSTLRQIRTLKDLNDQYIWQPGLAGLGPATILDRPYLEAVDMPDVADSAKPVVFGDFRRAYTIVDRVGMSIQRLTELHATTNQIGFIARRRVGGQVVLPEALAILTIT